ncbi:hypothetical protein yrohd0001_600 [Yersinia rohdei ATCC 43380]|nr:hypothetical protein yrohd0001_600 [Yersinia rohdei ATCC 43380]
MGINTQALGLLSIKGDMPKGNNAYLCFILIKIAQLLYGV